MTDPYNLVLNHPPRSFLFQANSSNPNSRSTVHPKLKCYHLFSLLFSKTKRGKRKYSSNLTSSQTIILFLGQVRKSSKMPSDSRIYYRTHDGGPPNGGVPIPPGAHISGFNAFLGQPPAHMAPPAYTARPVHFTAPAPSPAPSPYGGSLPWPQFLPYPVPVMQIPEGFYPPPLPLPPPSQPPRRPEPREPPGAKLDGAKIEFNDGISTYIFPEDHAIIHLVNFEHQPWDHPGAEFGFSVHKVPCSMPLKELIRRLGCPGTSDAQRGIVECIERGDGSWTKGSVFRLDDDRSKQRLEEVGWTRSRGTDRKPVWLAVYKS